MSAYHEFIQPFSHEELIRAFETEDLVGCVLRIHLHLAIDVCGRTDDFLVELVIGEGFGLEGEFLRHGIFECRGLLVVEGVIRKALKARITRNDVIIYQGEIASLRRFKDDVPEVRAGLECGVTFTQNFTDIKAGDFLETYEVELRDRTL